MALRCLGNPGRIMKLYYGVIGAAIRNAVMIRHVGDYALTAHAAAVGASSFQRYWYRGLAA
ncbi:hypothetical protein XAC2911_680015 [Xanthomonas citri pv. citri]|nr:hypothetical protein XAC2911_680015 [Xanthomonas citri pv. citri]